METGGTLADDFTLHETVPRHLYINQSIPRKKGTIIIIA